MDFVERNDSFIINIKILGEFFSSKITEAYNFFSSSSPNCKEYLQIHIETEDRSDLHLSSYLANLSYNVKIYNRSQEKRHGEIKIYKVCVSKTKIYIP